MQYAVIYLSSCQVHIVMRLSNCELSYALASYECTNILIKINIHFLCKAIPFELALREKATVRYTTHLS